MIIVVANILLVVLTSLLTVDDSRGFAPQATRARQHVTALVSSSYDEQLMGKRLPKVVIFDLDGCLWRPEMYELLYFSGGAGAPFTSHDDNNDGNNILLTTKGEPVYLLGDVREIMRELYFDPKWNDALVGISSRTDQPDWARECLSKFQVKAANDDDRIFVLQDVFEGGPTQISHEPKVEHFRRISEDLDIPFEDMLFLDNEYWNCQDVSELGVTVAHCPDGVTKEIWKASLEAFPANQGNIVLL